MTEEDVGGKKQENIIVGVSDNINHQKRRRSGNEAPSVPWNKSKQTMEAESEKKPTSRQQKDQRKEVQLKKEYRVTAGKGVKATRAGILKVMAG